MKKITVFTPTYNRAYCLGRLYESLCRQGTKDFEWLIIDDGSVDNTKALVARWAGEGKVDIRYIYKTNGGMHTAHNVAYEHINTELNVCIDSDDYLQDGALAKIIDFWNAHAKPSWAGLIGLDAYSGGGIVGTPFPAGMAQCKYFELRSKYGVRGDKKFVYRTDVIRQYPAYPVFEDERFVPLGYKYLLIDQDYDLGVMHEVLCIVEYMVDGSTKNILRQYVRNPKGFAHERLVRMRFASTIRERFQNAVHYVSCSMFSRNLRFLQDSSNVGLTTLAIPFGILLNVYIRCRVARREEQII